MTWHLPDSVDLRRRLEQERAWIRHTDDIFVASKAGVLDRVKSIVKADPESVNLRYFDATPLYYACMAGHFEVCEFLLEHGANCAEDSYDGDRCLYGALNDKIRNLLREYSQRRTVVLSPLGRDIAKLEKDAKLADIAVEVGEKEFSCHRVILAARVPKFARYLRRQGPWSGVARVRLRGSSSAPAFSALLHFLYTDVLECPVKHSDELFGLCTNLGLRKLATAIRIELRLLSSVPKTDAHRQRELTSKGKMIFKMHPVGETLSEDLGRGFILQSHLADHVLHCEGKSFPVHAAVVFPRSQYLSNLLQERMAKTFGDTSVIHAYPANVLHCALMFLYTNGPGCDEILFAENHVRMEEGAKDKVNDEEKARQDLLALVDLATAYFIEGLADWAARCLASHGLLNRSNVWTWLSLTFSYDSPSLRKACFDTLGEGMVHDEVSGASAEPLIHMVGNELADLCGDDAELRNFYIAEIREAFVEALPAEVSIERRDAITDAFEEALGYTDPQPSGDKVA